MMSKKAKGELSRTKKDIVDEIAGIIKFTFNSFATQLKTFIANLDGKAQINDVHEFNKIIKLRSDSIIELLEIFSECHNKSSSSHLENPFEKTVIELKKFVLRHYSNSIKKDLDISDALNVANELLFLIHEKETDLEINNKLPSKWDETLKNRIIALEVFRGKEIKWKQIELSQDGDKKKNNQQAFDSYTEIQNDPIKPLLLTEIALLCILKKETMNRSTAPQVANKYGFLGKATGLYNIYIDLSPKLNRTGQDTCKTASDEKLIKLYNKVIPLIDHPENKKEAEAELMLLEGFRNKTPTKK